MLKERKKKAWALSVDTKEPCQSSFASEKHLKLYYEKI